MEELDFRLVFEEDARAAGPDLSARTLVEQLVDQELHNFPHQHHESQGPQYGALGNPRTFDCPSIQITSIAPNNHVEPGGHRGASSVGGAEGGYPEASWSRGQLYLPLDPCYRDPALCPSPCSSLSSRSWMSDLSSCESVSQVYDDVEAELRAAARLALGSPIGSPLGSPGCGGGAFGVELWQQKYQHPLSFSPALSPHQSPRQSPRTSVTEESWLSRRPPSRPSSRSTSPCGKRRHSGADPLAGSPTPHRSPSPTPGASPLGSLTDDVWVGSPSAGALGPLLMASYQELDVPSKTRRTQLGFLAGQGDPGLEAFLDSPGEEGLDQDGLADLFFEVPSHFSWNKPKPGNPPLFRTSSPPPLDWPLPSQYDQCELEVEVQPRSYHRAHYETEGSRGSLKAASTAGHPVVRLTGSAPQPLSLQLFIGTADDRYLRPHSFYQVHRVTGKTVATTCHEKIVGGTKVLEIPLLPENNMAASIDCAGVLKLRNADIELKKGEMDIGRKNTRVCVVFRVAVPQPDGRALWLQTTSTPVECSQRSGQDLPLVESFSPASCSVAGGDELLISGANISTQSRVVFTEKGSDGRPVWEMDGRVVPEKSSSTRLLVEVPPYCRKTSEPVPVQFYVSNGKRRRSLPQTVTFLPGAGRRPPAVKQELWETDRVSHNAPGHRALGPDLVYYDSRDAPVHCGPPAQSAPRLHHPPPSSVPFQAFTAPPQTSMLPPQTSSVALQTFTAPPGAPRRGEPSPLGSRRAFETPADPLKDSQASGPELRVKREPDDGPHLEHQEHQEHQGLQEITLDDVSEIIGRDIGSIRFDQLDQYHQNHGAP